MNELPQNILDLINDRLDGYSIAMGLRFTGVKPDEVDRPAPTPTLRNLIRTYLEPEDHDWAEKVAFCESSAQPDDVFSFAVNKSSRAAGWFQHLPKFWEERTGAAGIPGASIADPVAQLKVAAYLLYETPQGRGHWMQSQACWG